MPSEVRHLIFSSNETLAAVRELRRRRGQPLASGNVRVAEIIADPEIGYRLIIAPNGGGPEREYLINTTELGAALVFFCISRGIPLPASAPKSLRISGGVPVLVINKSASRAQLERLLRAPEPFSTPRATVAAEPDSPRGHAIDL